MTVVHRKPGGLGVNWKMKFPPFGTGACVTFGTPSISFGGIMPCQWTVLSVPVSFLKWTRSCWP